MGYYRYGNTHHLIPRWRTTVPRTPTTLSIANGMYPKQEYQCQEELLFHKKQVLMNKLFITSLIASKVCFVNVWQN